MVAERDGPETRYRLLETIREYGEERLVEHDETETVRFRHAEFYRDFARGFVSGGGVAPDRSRNVSLRRTRTC